jgi:hypothetical protein
MDSSEIYPLAQALMDSIGPRLTGSPGIKAGNDWLVSRYRAWGIEARNEPGARCLDQSDHQDRPHDSDASGGAGGCGSEGYSHLDLVRGLGRHQDLQRPHQEVPTLDLSCEDYGLLYRLAENNQSPVIQVEAQAETMGDVPVFNTIARVPAGVIPSVARDLRRQSQTSLEIPR